MPETKSVPLEALHVSNGARMVPFAGWSMPVQYTSIIQEHLAVRNDVGLFDVSHMGEFILTGEDCTAWLESVLTNEFGSLAVGRSRYSMMCLPTGGVVDDLIVYRLEQSKYLICVNAGNLEKDFKWMRDSLTGFDVQLEDQSDDFVLLAVQGPNALEFVAPLIQGELPTTRFSHSEVQLAGNSIILSRTGYTGEDGYEIYANKEAGESIFRALSEQAKELGKGHFLCGLGARDSLRLEAGFPLFGHEISEAIDPISARLGWTVKLDKPGDFIGKDSLKQIKQDRPKRVIIYFVLEDRRIAREGDGVWLDGIEVGSVRSGSFSPVINKPIGSALVDRESANAEGLVVRLRGKSISMIKTKAPLHQNYSD